MGAWDTDPFGNDTACDWQYELESASSLEPIQQTIGKVLRAGKKNLDAPDAEAGIAAADTIARLKGHFYVKNSYTETVDKWVAAHKLTPPPELVNDAIRAIERILTQPSELLDLWEESGEFESWKQHLDALKTRLQ
ncbi:MAG: DUF4259 domain-containing protein [candidate division Zixibacteria bacterium]|nr:DUF4259 domain-containing protein [candidate division Zixibacteria bacterium]